MSLTPSRRQVLQASALLAAAACTSRSPKPTVVDPDVALRAAAVARERALLAAYDAAPRGARLGALAAVRADHEAHLAALAAPVPGPSTPVPSPTTTAAPPAATPVTIGELAAHERATAAAHATDALRASRPLAAVLASLAASEASHAVALA
jgi:hypothetical protein